ncbi:MAG: hypothetical protein NT013_09565 [Planctomycetia bacterium]|nr:hypothetical protein [Planctomycetia bacterium]
MPTRRAIAIVAAMTLGVLLVCLYQETLHAQLSTPVPEFAAPLTAEQFEVGNEFLDDFGWIFWSLAEGFLVIEEPGAMVEIDPSELDEAIESNFDAFRPRVKAQLLFLRKTGNLSEEQLQTISECGEYMVRETLRKHVIDSLQAPLRELDTNSEAALPQIIQKTLVDFVKSQINADQFQQYDAELKARTAHRKRVTILNVVARLDAELLLLPEQREQFSKLIESEWQDSWGQSMGALMPDANFIPALPDDKVLAILKDYQQAVWKTKTYNRESSGWDDDPLGFLEVDEELDAEPDDMNSEKDEAKPLANRD